MRGGRLFVAVVMISLLACVSPALGWNADFFDADSSGCASYEEMAISPQAVFDADAGTGGKTYIAYQGTRLASYIIAYDHGTDSWEGAYQIGANSLIGDLHGAPSILVDNEGYIFAFYGAHLTPMRYARSLYPRDISEWVDLGDLRVGPSARAILASYPQPTLESSGTIRLNYRRDDDLWGTRGDWESVVSTGNPLAPGWTAPEMVLHGVWNATNTGELETLEGETSEQVNYYWYANFFDNGFGTPAFAAIRRDFLEGISTDYYNRKGVYYAKRSVEGSWTNAAGDAVAPEMNYAALRTDAEVLPEVEGEFTNQIVLRQDASGVPFVLYLVGPNVEGEPYEWRFARWGGAEWKHAKITETDDLFDAGTFEILEGGTIEAFLTTGGYPDDQWLEDPATSVNDAQLAKRGGDIALWRSKDGIEWVKDRNIITSPGPAVRYNNPQIVRGYDSEARLLFSEWNNDASNFIHKVYLYGDQGFKRKAFTPKIKRLAGANRIETAVEISKQTFPLGTSTAVLATANNFPDALCGVPLAHAYRAPILLCNGTSLDAAVSQELQRLDVSRVIILGGSTSMSDDLYKSVKSLKNSKGTLLKVERIWGPDRYATAVAVADKLDAKRGSTPARIVLASGEDFPDALSASPYAARRGYPILLTPSSRVSTPTLDAMIDRGPESVIVVGGEAAIASEVETSYAEGAWTSTDRWAGDNRYATARVVADHAISEGHSLERFGLATGANFADAVSGGLLVARVNGVLLMTRPASLHPEVEDFLGARAFGEGRGVLDAYVLGGSAALSADVEIALAERLAYLDSRTSE
ncbi:MAG: cell wall-binding repeat-containing protein [Coriobacteriia bacterium]